MLYKILKVLPTALIIVGVSEISKRSTLLASLLASLPMISFITIMWMKYEKAEISRISSFSREIFWMVLPSLAFFILFPWLLDRGMGFYKSMGLATSVMMGLYMLLAMMLKKWGILLP